MLRPTGGSWSNAAETQYGPWPHSTYNLVKDKKRCKTMQRLSDKRHAIVKIYREALHYKFFKTLEEATVIKL